MLRQQFWLSTRILINIYVYTKIKICGRVLHLGIIITIIINRTQIIDDIPFFINLFNLFHIR